MLQPVPRYLSQGHHALTLTSTPLPSKESCNVQLKAAPLNGATDGPLLHQH